LEAAVMGSLGIIEETIVTLAPRAALRRRPARTLGLALWTFVHGFSTLAHDKAAYPNARRAARAFDDMLTPMLIGMFGGRCPADLSGGARHRPRPACTGRTAAWCRRRPCVRARARARGASRRCPAGRHG